MAGEPMTAVSVGLVSGSDDTETACEPPFLRFDACTADADRLVATVSSLGPL